MQNCCVCNFHNMKFPNLQAHIIIIADCHANGYATGPTSVAQNVEVGVAGTTPQKLREKWLIQLLMFSRQTKQKEQEAKILLI